MALKPVIATKTEYDALPEAVRAEYTEKDGKWHLTVDGFVTKTEHDELKVKLSEFRDNNRTMFDELKVLKPIGEKLKARKVDDLDAFLTEHDTLKTTADELKKKTGGTGDLDAAIAAAIKPISDKLTQAETARIDAENRANQSRFRELITADAQKAGVKPASIRHVLREADEKFEFKDGTVKPKTGVRHPTDPLKELTPADWLTELATTDEYLFGDSTGGGAEGRRIGIPPRDVKTLVNPSPEEMGRQMDDIASGKVKVVRQ